MILLVAVCCALATCGALFIYRGLMPPKKALTILGNDLLGAAPSGAGHWWLDEIEAKLSGVAFEQRSSDLAVSAMSQETWVWRRRAWIAGSTVVTFVVSLLLMSVFGGGLGPVGIVLSLVVGSIAGWAMAIYELNESAEKARQEFRHAVSIYLELAAVALAGGAGPAEAMRVAAVHGEGRAFSLIDSAIAASEAQRISPYIALKDLGRQLGVAELEEVGNAMSLADEKGAPIRSTLNTKASSVTFRLLNAEQAAAESRSVTMSLPSVLMLAGFLIFLMYPFLEALVSTTR